MDLQQKFAPWLVPVFALACSSVADNDPSLWTPSQDLGGTPVAAGGNAGAPQTGGTSSSGGSDPGTGGTQDLPDFGTGGMGGTGAGTNSGACRMTFDFDSVTARGKYSPKNIQATWIAAPGNVFVKTLEVHAKSRIVHLIDWNRASKGNKVDAITSATLPNHGHHQVVWDCTDVNHNPVPDGPYRIYFEFTEDDSAFIIFPAPKLAFVDVVKGSPADFSPPDQQYFKNLHVSMQ